MAGLTLDLGHSQPAQLIFNIHTRLAHPSRSKCWLRRLQLQSSPVGATLTLYISTLIVSHHSKVTTCVQRAHTGPVQGKKRQLYTINITIKSYLFIHFQPCQAADTPHPSGRPCRLPPKATKVNCLSRFHHSVLYVPSHPAKVSCTISAPLQGDCCFIWAMTT